MYSIKEFFKRSPSEISTGVITLVDLGAILDIIELTKDQLAALNIALVTVLGLFYVKATTTNTAKLVEVQEAVQQAALAGGNIVTGTTPVPPPQP